MLDLLSDRVLSRRDFAEGPSGHVRLMPELAKSLVEAWVPELSRAVAPWAEQVATEIAKAAGIGRIATRLTESNRSAGRDPYRKASQRARTRKRVAERMVPKACRECGEVLRGQHRLLWDACLLSQRVESGRLGGKRSQR